MAGTIVIGSDYSLILRGAKNAVSGAALTSATVTAQLYTSAGAAVGSPVSCTYVSASAGTVSDAEFSGTIESTTTTTLTAGSAYYVLYTLASGALDFTFREDLTAQAPGSVIVDSTIWSASTGTSLTAGSADELSVQMLCDAVSEALTRRCYPALLAPKTLSLFPFDAPPTPMLLLPRPIRSISAIYLHPGADGDSSLVDLTADLLVAHTDYWLKPDDALTGWSRSGIVYRRGASSWGSEARRAPGTLARVTEPHRGALFVSGSFGPASVSPVVREAACRAVTLVYNSRTHGGAVQSQSWNGGSFSLASSVTAESAIGAPDVVSLLKSVGALVPHFA